MTAERGQPGLVDNAEYGDHGEALAWLAEHFDGPLRVAAGYVGLDGLDALARAAAGREGGARLLIGVAPPAEGPPDGRTRTPEERFEASRAALRRERDFSGFPAARRAKLERVRAFFASDAAEVRRYAERFLHGKAYAVGELAPGGAPARPGAALVTSANLTAGGLAANLELGVAHYDPAVVTQALEWHGRLWERAEDFRAGLLELLRPPPPEASPGDVFLRALLHLYGDGEPPEAGADRLTAFQRDGLARARRILDAYGGVLYADGVGMGKTEIGIELAREYALERGEHVLIVAPAGLRDGLWTPRVREANVPADVLSYQQLAGDRQLSDGDGRALPVDKDAYRLVVVDEAHAYRNEDNTWYAALDRLMGGARKRLLLLTATPVNNALGDLRNLFRLFGRHDRAFDGEPLRIPGLREFFRGIDRLPSAREKEERLFPLIDALAVRRDRAFVEERYPGERLAGGALVRFPAPVLHAVRYDLDEAYPGAVEEAAETIEALTMARYRPEDYLADAAAPDRRAGALAGLVRSQLLKRFESSWRAALLTAERMLERNGETLRALVDDGRVRTAGAAGDAARDIAGERAEEFADEEGALPGGEDEADGEGGGWLPATAFRADFGADLRRDGELLGGLTRMLRDIGERPDPKIEAMRRIMEETPAEKVAVFTSFRDTAAYLRERLEEDGGLGGGRDWVAVLGAETSAREREHGLARFCPLTAARDGYGPRGGEADLLLSTDVLSEGQNLQQAQAVLSWDMPWNPQRVVQRNGRVIRMGSPHEEALLYTLMPERGGLEPLLRLEARLRAKIEAANAAVGMESPVLSGDDGAQRIYADLDRFAGRLGEDDAALLDERASGGSAFEGERFRDLVRRAREEGEARRVLGLPWGIGAAFAQPDGAPYPLGETAVFFACETRAGERYWRMVSAGGAVLHRDDLPMLRLIDPEGGSECPVPDGLDLDGLFAAAAADICERHNALLDPARRYGDLPPSQRWAVGVLRSPDRPEGARYADADRALAVPRNPAVLRELSALRRDCESGAIGLAACAGGIAGVVERFGLRPVEEPPPRDRVEPDDLGVLCWQAVLPTGSGGDARG